MTLSSNGREFKTTILRERTASHIALNIQIVRLNYQIKQQHEYHILNPSPQGPTSLSLEGA